MVSSGVFGVFIEVLGVIVCEIKTLLRYNILDMSETVYGDLIVSIGDELKGDGMSRFATMW
jgi:hypothetical protein